MEKIGFNLLLNCSLSSSTISVSIDCIVIRIYFRIPISALIRLIRTRWLGLVIQLLLFRIDLLGFTLQLSKGHTIGVTMNCHDLFTLQRQTLQVCFFQIFLIGTCPLMLSHNLIELHSILGYIISFTMQSLQFR